MRLPAPAAAFKPGPRPDDVLRVLYDLAELVYRTMEGGPGFLTVLLLWIPVQSVLLTAIHEAGHALAALARRQPGVELTVGGGEAMIEARLRDVKLRLAAPAPLRAASGQVRWDGERTTLLDLLLIALAGPAASLAGALATGWLASRTGPGDLHDFLALMTLAGVLFGALLNLVPFTLTEGTRRRPGAAVRTDGGIALDVVRVLARTA